MCTRWLMDDATSWYSSSGVSPKRSPVQFKNVLTVYKNASGKNKQNLMRIKVNKPAIIGSLIVEDVLPHLEKSDLFTTEEVKQILMPDAKETKAAEFLKILDTKNTQRGWYEIFRTSLSLPQCHSDMDNINNHKVLIGLLDSTILYKIVNQGCTFSNSKVIPPIKPKCGIALDRTICSDTMPATELELPDAILDEDAKTYKEVTSLAPSIITTITDPTETESKIFEVVTEPKDLYRLLIADLGPESIYHIAEEKEVVEAMKNLELILEIYYKKCTTVNLATCNSLMTIILDSNRHYMYIKHFQKLSLHYGKDILEDITNSFIETLDEKKSGDQSLSDLRCSIHAGFLLIHLNKICSKYELGTKLTNALVNSILQREKWDILMSLFQSYVYMMQMCNHNFDLAATNAVYFKAMEIIWEIEKVSFGQRIVNFSEFYMSLSYMLYEEGSITSAYTWSYKALQEATDMPPGTIVDVLCNCILCCCALTNKLKAYDVAVQVVRYARHEFNIRHPKYLKALIYCCHYLNCYQHDTNATDIAELTLKTAMLVYNCDTIHVAFAHMAMSKALIAAKITYANDLYFHHGLTAIETAKAVLAFHHPMLYKFYLHFAHVLYVRAKKSADVTTKRDMLESARSCVIRAYKMICEIYGDCSLPLGNVYEFFSKIYKMQEKLKATEEMLLNCITTYTSCLTPNHKILLNAKYKLATFYRTQGRLEEAYEILSDLVAVSDTINIFEEWMQNVFEDLIVMLKYRDTPAEAESVKLKLVRWLANTLQRKKPNVTMKSLTEAPIPYVLFMSSFSKWHKSVDRILREGDVSPDKNSAHLTLHKSI